MSEAEVLELMIQSTDSVWGLIQWWASVSLAIIAAGHITADNLKNPILITVIATYTFYTLMIASEITFASGIYAGLAQDLDNLAKQGVLGSGGLSILEQIGRARIGDIAITGTGISTYFITIGYLIYRSRQNEVTNV